MLLHQKGVYVRKISIVLGMVFLLAGIAGASLGVYPSRQELVLDRGEVFRGTYTVTNRYEVPITVAASQREWFISSENKGIPIAEWFSVSPESAEIAVGATKDFYYEVRVPSAAAGSLVAMISFTAQHPDATDINLMVSVPVFVIVADANRVDWDMSSIAARSASEGLSQISAKVINKGNVHLRPSGIVIVHKGKMEVMRVPFIESRPVYPELDRMIITDGFAQLAPGAYTVTVQVTCYEETMEKKASLRIKKDGTMMLKEKK